jgi:hypothetical protein
MYDPTALSQWPHVVHLPRIPFPRGRGCFREIVGHAQGHLGSRVSVCDFNPGFPFLSVLLASMRKKKDPCKTIYFKNVQCFQMLELDTY